MTSLSTNEARSAFDWKYPLSMDPAVSSHPDDSQLKYTARSAFDWKHPLCTAPVVSSHPNASKKLEQCWRDRMISDPESPYNKNLSPYQTRAISSINSKAFSPIQIIRRSTSDDASFITRSPPSDFPWLAPSLIRMALFYPHGTKIVRDYTLKFFEKELPALEEQHGSITRGIIAASLAVTSECFNNENMEESGTEGVYAVFDQTHNKALFSSWGNKVHVILYRRIQGELKRIPVSRTVGWMHQEPRHLYSNITKEKPPLVIPNTPKIQAWQQGTRNTISDKEIFLQNSKRDITSCASGIGFFSFSWKEGEKDGKELRRPLITPIPNETRVDL